MLADLLQERLLVRHRTSHVPVAIRGFPVPTGGFGKPEHVAAAVAFLLSSEARFCCGSVLFVDGGTDALMRPDQY